MARQTWIAVARVADLGAPALALAQRRLGRRDRRRYVRFRSDKRRREFLAGRCLLQRLGKGLPFDSSPEGGVKMSGRFGASLSHARGWVACVVVSSGRPGIDIEPMVERDFASLGKWAFGSGSERARSFTSREDFYERWTRYEARLKAFGDGEARGSHAERTWLFPDRVALSVCVPGRSISFRLRRIGS